MGELTPHVTGGLPNGMFYYQTSKTIHVQRSRLPMPLTRNYLTLLLACMERKKAVFYMESVAKSSQITSNLELARLHLENFCINAHKLTRWKYSKVPENCSEGGTRLFQGSRGRVVKAMD